MCAWSDVLGLRWSLCIYATAATEDDGVDHFGSGARDDGDNNDDDDKLTLTYHGPEGWPAGTESTGVEVVVVHVVMHVVMGRRLGLLWHLTATPTHSNIKHQTLTTLPLSAHVMPSVYPHTHHLQYTHTTTSTRKNQSAQVHWIISPAIHTFRIDPFFRQQTVSKSTNKRPVHVGQHCVLVLLGHKSGDWKLCNSLIFHRFFIDLLSVARSFIYKCVHILYHLINISIVFKCLCFRIHKQTSLLSWLYNQIYLGIKSHDYKIIILSPPPPQHKKWKVPLWRVGEVWCHAV